MDKQIWIIAGGVTTAFLVAVLALTAYTKTREAAHARVELAEAVTAAERAASQNEAQLTELKGRLAENEARIEQLEQEKQTVVQSSQSLEDQMRAALESKDVTISQLQGKLTVNILDRLLFDSGEAQVKPDGQKVLRKVAEILQQHTNLQVHVIGHTDNVPIRATAQSRYASNWELSTARATAAVRFLTEQCGVAARRLGAVGYGEFRPVADNATPEGRARNRRIAITILSEELVGSDVVPTVTTNLPVLPSTLAPVVPVTVTNSPTDP